MKRESEIRGERQGERDMGREIRGERERISNILRKREREKERERYLVYLCKESA
jgi:hypothetical protein